MRRARALAGVRRRAGGAQPACPPATARAARWWSPPTATTPRRCGACTSSSWRSGSTSSGCRRARCRRLEPGLSPRIAGGILAHGDAQADPRATVRALAERGRRRSRSGVEVEAIEHDARTRDRGADRARARSSAARWWWPPGRGARRSPPRARARRCGPVKGQILELRVRGGEADAARRGSCARRAATSSPARDGRVMLGATSRSRASTPRSPPTACIACSRRPGRWCRRWASSSW